MIDDGTAVSECIGNLPCGSHFCAFYSTPDELAGTLVPFFAAGLQQDQLCLYVTSDASGVEGVKRGLRHAVPHFDRYLDLGQIEIWDYCDWYLRGGHFDADRVFGQFAEKEQWALDRGYTGLRGTGDSSWIKKADWPDFMAYEAEVNRVIQQHRMIGLCTYRLDRCAADGVLAVAGNHQFAVGRIAGRWKIIESSSLNLEVVKDQIEQSDELDIANAILTKRLRIEATQSKQLQRLAAHLLEKHDADGRRIAVQLHEGIAQNICAIALYLADMQWKRAWPTKAKSLLAKCRTLCEQSIEQIRTLSRQLHPSILDEFGLTPCLRSYIEDFVKQSGIQVEFESDSEIGRLPLEMETHLFRVAQEGLSNILRHSGSLNAIVRLKRQADQVILQIEDFGRGTLSGATQAVSGRAGEAGLGIVGMKERLQQIGGILEIRSSHQGTTLTAIVRL